MREKDTQTINSEKRRETERQGEKETKEIRKPVGQCSIEYNNLTVRDKSMKEREGERERKRQTERRKEIFAPLPCTFTHCQYILLKSAISLNMYYFSMVQKVC